MKIQKDSVLILTQGHVNMKKYRISATSTMEWDFKEGIQQRMKQSFPWQMFFGKQNKNKSLKQDGVCHPSLLHCGLPGPHDKGQSHKVINSDSIQKCLTEGICIPSMNSVPWIHLTSQAKLQFEDRHTAKQTDRQTNQTQCPKCFNLGA